jgi:uncharacterized membrane protein YfcA
MVNSLVGGGSLISFPVLLALGLPTKAANVTNTMALCPGYIGGAWAQRDSLRGQRDRLMRLAGVSVLGGLAGALLLLVTSDDALKMLIPVLLGLGTLLLALSQRLRKALGGAEAAGDTTLPDAKWLPVVVGFVAVYGGYFGAGIGVMLLAVLSIGVQEPLTRSNALKQVLSLIVNLSAAVFFVFSGEVRWGLAGVMSVGGLIGGNLGGHLTGRIDPGRFRVVVVVIGATLTVVYAVKNFT